MKHRIFWPSILSTALVLASPVQADEHTVEKTIDVGTVERSYLLHIPPSLPRDKAVPLVVVFHGGGGTGAIGERFTRFSELSDHERFIVVYPDALNKNWNDGRNEPMIRSMREKVDDVGFTTALLAELQRTCRIDPKRVYATGPSNGGIMSNLAGARLADRFAAIAPVIGGIASPVAENFHPSQPVSVLIINGTEDPLVPFEGGRVTFMGRGRGSIISTAETVQRWVAHNGCRSKPSTGAMPDKDPEDGTRSTVETYAGGRNGTEVVVFTIEGGGHAWPGGRQYLPVKTIGRVCRDFDATTTIWEFFKAHPKP